MALPKPNHQGRWKKADVIANGYEILDYGDTASDVEKETGIKLDPQQRIDHCMGFRCEKAWRGCVPVFDIMDIAIKKSKGLL